MRQCVSGHNHLSLTEKIYIEILKCLNASLYIILMNQFIKVFYMYYLVIDISVKGFKLVLITI